VSLLARAWAWLTAPMPHTAVCEQECVCGDVAADPFAEHEQARLARIDTGGTR